jgi:putative intracellular protease/amidase
VKIIIPIPNADFDPSEAAVSWQILRTAGHEVSFATPDGKRGYGDVLMLTGEGLDVWGFVPGLRTLHPIGNLLAANADARAAYAELERDPAFLAPARHDELRVEAYDALVLPGGHRAAGMVPYLESAALGSFVAGFFDADKPVAAICHGVLVAARARSAKSGRSVLHGRKTTSLTWALERSAWNLGRVVRFWDPNYYRTYVEAPGEARGYRSVEAEVTRALASPEDYRNVPKDAPDYGRKTDGLHRDTAGDSRPAFVVRDGNYVSARWPGDVHTFAKTFIEVLAERKPATVESSHGSVVQPT